MKITILICTHNRVRLLQRTLASLNAALRPAECELHILVVANACTDDTVSALRAYQSDAESKGALPLEWIEEPIPGKSRALNRALPDIDAPVTAFVDDDHRVDPRYLVEIYEATRAFPEADLFCGRILPDWDGAEPAWTHDRGPYRIYPLPVPNFDLGDKPFKVTRDVAVPGGGNLFFRTRVFSTVGPFATDFGPVGHNLGGAEDIQWVVRALELGNKLQYVPGAVQYHYVDHARLAISYLMRKAYERSASTVRLSAARRQGSSNVPLFMLRKTLGYMVRCVFCFGRDARRFYLVRLAAALGEVKGFRLAKSDRNAAMAKREE